MDDKKVRDIIMLYDNSGFGDLIACCPNCKKAFNILISFIFSKTILKSYPCNYSDILITVPE